MLDIEELKRYVNEQFNGNISKAAKAIGISHSGLYRIITKQRNPGFKTINVIMKYWTDHQENFKEYIFFSQVLTKVNYN